MKPSNFFVCDPRENGGRWSKGGLGATAKNSGLVAHGERRYLSRPIQRPDWNRYAIMLHTPQRRMRLAMRLTHPDTFLERIAESRGPQKIRLEAIRSIKYPSVAFLLRLLRSDAPAKVRALAALRYREIFERKKAHAQNAKNSPQSPSLLD